MGLNLEDKKAIVSSLNEEAATAVSAIAADYRGLDVEAMNSLRAKGRASGVSVKIVRNTLARRAFDDTDHACMKEALMGPIVLLLSQEEPGAGAKLLRDFIKDHDAVQVRALSVSGELYGPEKLKDVAALPSRNEALAQLMSVMQAPITKFVRTLKEPVAQTVRVMAAVRDQKENS